jgi:hypothetical protein
LECWAAAAFGDRGFGVGLVGYVELLPPADTQPILEVYGCAATAEPAGQRIGPV